MLFSVTKISLYIRHYVPKLYTIICHYIIYTAYAPANQSCDHEVLFAQGKGSCKNCVTSVSSYMCLILLTEVQMHELNKIVIPKIMANWEDLAYCMRYKPSDVKGFKADSQDLKGCCKKFLLNWITTNHDPQPKTYQALMNYINEVDDLAAASEAIKKELIQGIETNNIISYLL